MEVNNIKGITISEMAKELSLHPQTIDSVFRKVGINPIGYIGHIRIYSETALEVIKERNTRTGRRAKVWQPQTLN
jgi:DNA-binding transcriptional MerR regulator